MPKLALSNFLHRREIADLLVGPPWQIRAYSAHPRSHTAVSTPLKSESESKAYFDSNLLTTLRCLRGINS